MVKAALFVVTAMQNEKLLISLMKTLDIIYASATSSIDGLPAIREAEFKKLSKDIDDSFKNELYWKQRCQWAEILLDPTYSEKSKAEIYKKWNELRRK